MPNRLRGRFFLSAETTGNAGAQNIAHGLGVKPQVTIVIPSKSSTTDQITWGTADNVNCVVTAPATVKYRVLALV